VIVLYIGCAGKGGAEGDGDIYNPENLVEFQRFVLENTNQRDPGVHFVMADGVSLHAMLSTASNRISCFFIFLFLYRKG